MKKETKQSLMVSGIVLLAVLIDQAVKIYVKTHFYLGESVEVTPWFYICFVENNGMAFGIEWFSKLLLTLFRIVAVGALGYYTHLLIHKKAARTGFIATVAFVIAGALGNIIDCVCYGRIWDYAGWFYGRVVDMLYFPLIKDAAGNCLFFQPVFNIADSCITCAVIAILLFYRRDLNDSLEKKSIAE